MSILDSINAAEERAAQLRQEAKAKAREDLRLAEEEARARRESRLAEERSARESRLKAAEKAADDAMDQALKNLDAQNAAMMAKAREKKKAAVEFILERVEAQ